MIRRGTPRGVASVQVEPVQIEADQVERDPGGRDRVERDRLEQDRLEQDQEDDIPVPRHPGRGDTAPDFTLPGTGGLTYRLSDHAGEPVVVVFYPADNSPVCTLQLRSYSEDLNAFEALGANVLCLSPQDVDSHERFARANDLRVPLLADVGAKVGEAYNILGPLGFYRRSVFVVDPGGIIRFARRSLSSLTFVPADTLIEAVRATLG